MNTDKKKRSRYIDFIAIAFIALGLISAYRTFDKSKSDVAEVCIDENVLLPQLKYGFDPSVFSIEEHTLFPDQFLSEILTKYDVGIEKIFELEKKAKDVFSVRNIRAGKKYAIVRKDSCSAAECFVYEPDPYRYVLYNFKDSISVDIVERDVTVVEESTAGVVQSSLWLSMKEKGLSPVLIDKMEDALAWSIDFYHIQDGDKYKLVFERKFIDGKPVGIGQLKGAYYENSDNGYYAVYYESENYEGYYDLEGRPTKKGFLKSPVRASRISSKFNMNRYHPILKRRKPHLGTDYAAPYGTPILATANGVVTNAGYTKGNGKFVKLKHDKTYSTQYLHMQRFAKGVRSGVHVKQGQVIGYVGSTGLATGPHVCYRFWKNGRQVNHLRENFPPPDPMEESELPKYFKKRDLIVNQLNQLEFPGYSEEKPKEVNEKEIDPILMEITSS